MPRRNANARTVCRGASFRTQGRAVIGDRSGDGSLELRRPTLEDTHSERTAALAPLTSSPWRRRQATLALVPPTAGRDSVFWPCVLRFWRLAEESLR